MKRIRLRPHLLMTAIVLLSAGASGAFGDALHGFCVPNVCIDNQTVTPWTGNTQFGFWTDGNTQSSDYMIAILTPSDSVASGFVVSGGANGPAVAVSEGFWSSGDLESFLGLNGTPVNPIDAFLPTTNTYDSSATGYNVFLADLGWNTLGTSAGAAPLLSLNQNLALGSVVVGFLDPPAQWIDTASSGALLVESGNSVPEPSAFLLFGPALIGLAMMKRKRYSC